MNQSELLIKDELDTFYGNAVARFHFHPNVQVNFEPNHKSGTVVLKGNKMLTCFIDHGIGSLEESSWHPRFGESHFNFCLQIKLLKGLSIFRLQLS